MKQVWKWAGELKIKKDGVERHAGRKALWGKKGSTRRVEAAAMREEVTGSEGEMYVITCISKYHRRHHRTTAFTPSYTLHACPAHPGPCYVPAATRAPIAMFQLVFTPLSPPSPCCHTTALLSFLCTSVTATSLLLGPAHVSSPHPRTRLPHPCSSAPCPCTRLSLLSVS